jgi:hypothetical protein
MSTTKRLLSELVHDFQSERWNEFESPKLSLRELQTLAKLLGCLSYGTKETLVVRRPVAFTSPLIYFKPNADITSAALL